MTKRTRTPTRTTKLREGGEKSKPAAETKLPFVDYEGDGWPDPPKEKKP